MFPGFFPSDNENEIQDEFFGSGDMMALKGQVWPGMGKMDLANEDMKRTRNQRKPKSVIEKMRRTSEGIEPTQVVMTAEFEVERVKDVYDSSSPVPDQEEAVCPPNPNYYRVQNLHYADSTQEDNEISPKAWRALGRNFCQHPPRGQSPSHSRQC